MKNREFEFIGTTDDQNAMLDKAVDEMNEMLEHFMFHGNGGELDSLKFTLKADAGDGMNVAINLNQKIYIDDDNYASVSTLKIAMKNQLCDVISAMCDFMDFDFTDFESDDYE